MSISSQSQLASDDSVRLRLRLCSSTVCLSVSGIWSDSGLSSLRMIRCFGLQWQTNVTSCAEIFTDFIPKLPTCARVGSAKVVSIFISSVTANGLISTFAVYCVEFGRY